MTTNQTIDGVPRELLERLVKIEAIERDDPNGSGYDLCPECFGEGKWNWKAGRVVSADPIAHREDCAIKELRALLDAPPESCGACNGCANGCRLDAESPPAQPQGAPVAWICHGPEGSGLVALQWSHLPTPKGMVRKIGLCAEQPAPVAAVPKSECPNCLGDAMFGCDACLDEVTRLNAKSR